MHVHVTVCVWLDPFARHASMVLEGELYFVLMMGLAYSGGGDISSVRFATSGLVCTELPSRPLVQLRLFVSKKKTCQVSSRFSHMIKRRAKCRDILRWELLSQLHFRYGAQVTATFTASAKILSIAHSTARKKSESGHLLVSCRQVLVFEGLVLITMLKEFFFFTTRPHE